MKKEDYIMEWNDDGSVRSEITHKEKVVEVKTRNGKKVLGTQPAYTIINIIDVDKVNDLKEYLEEQLEYLLERKGSAVDVIEKTKMFSLEGLKEAINKIPQDKLNSKKVQELNGIAKNALMFSEASKNLVILEDNIERIQKQLRFLNKET